jgi:molybdopterin/thiamine biosynthesis adenylyltransferase
LRIVIGESLIKEIEKCRLFMIGSGAIGCELLKNYAMLNLGTAKADTATNTKQGMIILTDPDHIEVSNLNRQFLFREKHIRKPKSSTAAASVIQMNPNLKGHISARLDKIS